MNKKVSIIVPVYNVESYLTRCIESLIKQTYTNIEILLIDDGSTDKSGHICDKFKYYDSRIFVYHKKNGGLSDARNYGIDRCTGDYIFFVDSDDWIEDNTIELLLKEAIKKNLDIVCCGIEKNYSFGKDEKFTDSGNVVFDIKSCISNYLSGRKVCTVAWNKLYRISLFENIRYPVGKLNEDEFTTYKLIIRANTVGYIENNLYHYYQRDDSIMGANKIIDRLDIFDALIERMNEFKKAGYIKYASLTWIQLVDTAYFYGVKTTLGENGSKRIQLLMQSISESMIQPIWYEISVHQRIKTNLKLFVLRTRTHRKKFRI